MIAPALKALILEQCLPILVTKASDPSVQIGRMSVPAIGLHNERELHAFHQEFMNRRLLAEAPELVRILQEIGQKPSWHNRLERVRDERLRGRLDVAQFVRDRARAVVRPRTFPLVTQERQFGTPENRLAAGVLGSIRRVLAREVFPARTAESNLALSYFRTLTRISRESVFRDFGWISIARRDIALARYRVDRRMTGNDRPYDQLLHWLENWLSMTDLAAASDQTRNVDLALPESESYWEKVFEVWCLEQTRSSLIRLGWHSDSDFRLHSAKAGRPIARFVRDHRTVEMYFQSQAPLGVGRWKNVRTHASLTGIPDLALTVEGGTPLIIDAKWRFRTVRQGTSEEQYKMLGYAENFSHNHPRQSFHGLLIFPSDVVDVQSYSCGYDATLTNIRTDLLSAEFSLRPDSEIAKWLER